MQSLLLLFMKLLSLIKLPGKRSASVVKKLQPSPQGKDHAVDDSKLLSLIKLPGKRSASVVKKLQPSPQGKDQTTDDSKLATNWENEVMKRLNTHWLNDNQYYREEKEKRQIYIHHTAGGANAYGVIDGWNNNSEHVATFCVIAGAPPAGNSVYYDGEIVQAFSSKYWAHHLYITAPGSHIPGQFKTGWNNTRLNSQSIGIEICNWGPLTLRDGKFKTYTNATISEDEVVEYADKYRGYQYYHKYTDKQLESLRALLMYLTDKYDIPRDYQGYIWNISEKALNFEPGIFTHTSVRTDKTDTHPQKELIEMLQSL